MNEADRAAVLQACRYVDHVEISNDFSVRDVVLRHGVTAIVHGDDWPAESYKAQIRCDDAFLNHHGVELVLLPYTPGVSTSDLIRTCASLQRAAEDSLSTGERDGDELVGERSCRA
jgi:glycerol-3-phosphate cytidylyltransferase-like family protein